MCDSKTFKSISTSMSDSCSNNSDSANWRFPGTQNDNLFYAKYIKEHYLVNKNRAEQFKNELEFQSPEKLMSGLKFGKVKVLTMTVSTLDRFRFGRRSSIIESMLGFKVNSFYENVNLLMVSKIIDTSLKEIYPHIEEGDWFKMLEDVEVTEENIDKLLLQYTKATTVKLTFVDSFNLVRNKRSVLKEVNNFGDYVIAFKNAFQKMNTLHKHKKSTFLALIISQEYFKFNSESIFYYPFTPNNFLYKARGSFFTLQSVINSDLNSNAKESTMYVDGTKYYVIYGYVNDSVVVCAYLSSCGFSRKVSKSKSMDFINFLQFYRFDLNSLQIKKYLTHICDILNINLENNNEDTIYNTCIEAYLNSSSFVALPKEAQLRIYDALSELQSMDNKKWNETKGNHREVVICGTALYHNKYLLASTLPAKLNANVEIFLRLQGIFPFVAFQNIEEMYVWKKMYTYETQCTYYIAICVHNSLVLVAVFKSLFFFKSNGYFVSYLEEISQTVGYLASCGIESLSSFWVNSSRRPLMNSNSTKSAQESQNFKLKYQKYISSESCDSNGTQPEMLVHKILQDDRKDNKNDEYKLNLCSNQCIKSNKGNTCTQFDVVNIIPLKLTSGWVNDIKFFLSSSFGQALVIKPFKPTCSPLHLDAIRDHILYIHHKLQHNHNVRKIQDKPFILNKGISCAKEYVTTFSILDSMGTSENVNIVGRMFFSPLKDIYICFGHNISQNLIETSFRSSFLNIG